MGVGERLVRSFALHVISYSQVGTACPCTCLALFWQAAAFPGTSALHHSCLTPTTSTTLLCSGLQASRRLTSYYGSYSVRMWSHAQLLCWRSRGRLDWL